MTHLYGITGQEEALAIKTLNKVKDFDDSGCNDDIDPMENFDESSYLEDCAFSTYGDIS